MIKTITERLNKIHIPSTGTPWALFGLGVIAFGLMLPQMGFYWDDWPWIWMAHVQGNNSLLKIDQAFRPLSGVILWLSYNIVSDNPLGWQYLTFFYRWLCGIGLWWMTNQIWPKQPLRAAWLAFIFLVYPGFGHSFVAVNSSRHILPFAFYFFSLGFMIRSIRNPAKQYFWVGLSLLFMLGEMLASEYYYGLELARPVFLWIASDAGTSNKSPLKMTFLRWLPYLLAALSLYAWRYLVSLRVNYSIILPSEISTNLTSATINSIQTIGWQIYVSTIGAWLTTFQFPSAETSGFAKVAVFWLVFAVCLLVNFGFFTFLSSEASGQPTFGSFLLAGVSCLLVGGLPFLVTGLAMDTSFPSSRTMLPMALGASLVFIGLVDAIGKWRWLKNVVVSLFIALAIGTQLQIADSFQFDWSYQKYFFQEMSWRIPGLAPGTAIYTNEFPNSYSTDNSLTAPLNWMYSESRPTSELPVMLFFLKTRLGLGLPALEKGQKIVVPYGDYTFRGDTDHVLVIYHNPPACLRVLHPEYDRNIPKVGALIEQALPLINLEQVILNPVNSAALPAPLGTKTPPPRWCEYFQKADLARQTNDWKLVRELGDAAFGAGLTPVHPSELIPFIQGYAYTGEWQKSRQLTNEAYQIHKSVRPMICDIWHDVQESTPSGIERDAVINEILDKYDC